MFLIGPKSDRPTKVARTLEYPRIERSAPVARAKNKNEDEAYARFLKECRSKGVRGR